MKFIPIFPLSLLLSLFFLNKGRTFFFYNHFFSDILFCFLCLFSILYDQQSKKLKKLHQFFLNSYTHYCINIVSVHYHDQYEKRNPMPNMSEFINAKKKLIPKNSKKPQKVQKLKKHHTSKKSLKKFKLQPLIQIPHNPVFFNK